MMKMATKGSREFLLAVLMFPSLVSAQGLVFNDSIRSQLSANYPKAEVSRSPLPARFSLKEHAPYVHYQLGSECVAYAFAAAHTIILGVAYDWTDAEKISLQSYSPHFIYYRNRVLGDDDCTVGLDPFEVAQDVVSTGMAKLVDVECPDYYPCNLETRLCGYYPPSYVQDLLSAANHRIDNIYLVENTQQIRTAIAYSRPVVIGMMVPESFRKAGDLWIPAKGETEEMGFGHAMVAVAYDDEKYGGAVQLLNSWGEQWGNKGYTWVRYTDFENFVQFGLALDREIGRYKAEAPDSLDIRTKYLDIKEADASALRNDMRLGAQAARPDSVQISYPSLFKTKGE